MATVTKLQQSINLNGSTSAGVAAVYCNTVVAQLGIHANLDSRACASWLRLSAAKRARSASSAANLAASYLRRASAAVASAALKDHQS